MVFIDRTAVRWSSDFGHGPMSAKQVKQRLDPLTAYVKSIQLVAVFVAAAVACCASRTESPDATAGSASKALLATVSMEPPIEVGDVTAVYITVTNDSSNSDPFTVALLELHWPHAVDKSGKRVDRLDTDQAIERAGGGEKMLAALGSRGNEVRRPLAHKIARYVLMAPVIPMWSPGLLVAGPVALIYSSLQEPEYRRRLNVEAKEFQLNPTELDPFGSPLLTDLGPPVSGLLPLWSEKGYVFFPRGSYTALEVTVRKYEEYERNSIPGHFETITCLWR
jgi:hypothetical protein